jgi:hypothetical protein
MKTEGLLSRRSQFLLLALALTISLSSCGMGYRPPYKLRLQSMELVGAGPLDTDNRDPNYYCGSKANVEPDWEWSLDGAGYYTICPSKTVYSNILVHGQTSLTNTICIFPAEYIDDRNIFTKPDLQTGGPMHKCVTATDRGVYTAFAGVRYNAAFIVESPHVEQMYACLVQRDSVTCPRYSFGIFR